MPLRGTAVCPLSCVIGMRSVLERHHPIPQLLLEFMMDAILHGGNMPGSYVPKSTLIVFRTVFYVCALYFFLMGILMMVFPELVAKNAGVQHPRMIGILRGMGGSILGSTIFYLLIASKPFERRWAAIVIAFANILAIVLDVVSVRLGEYTLDNALLDIPIESLSFLTIVIFYAAYRTPAKGT
jgi:hypothetical protein